MKAGPTEMAMVRLLNDHMAEHGILQTMLAARIGRTTKHVNQVLSGKARATDLDRWAAALGVRFTVGIEAA